MWRAPLPTIPAPSPTPTQRTGFYDRGKLYHDSRQFAFAAADYREAVRAGAGQGPAFRNQLAWLLATCPDEAVRNGTEAVEHATRSCELSKWQEYSPIDTLACTTPSPVSSTRPSNT